MNQPIEVKIPDIGDFNDVPIIDILVKVGDTVKTDDAVVTLESEKATLDVPSPANGVVKEIKVQLGTRVSEGTVILILDGDPSVVPAPAPSATANDTAPKTPHPQPVTQPVSRSPAAEVSSVPAEKKSPIAASSTRQVTHASPSVRAYARELSVDLTQVTASGPKGRILIEDVKNFVKQKLAAAASATPAGASLDLPPWPKVDFAKFGPVETRPLSRIQKISAANLARNWVMIPAVTYHEEADITDLEAFRVQLNKEHEKSGIKMTMLAFLIKACVKALQQYPTLNASLAGEGDEQHLVLKQYFNIGFAADTPNGLVVPVIKNADQKTILTITQETAALAEQARAGKLKPADMQGACFTISSLGGIGGTYFAPIINAPEVAILGVNKNTMKPVWNGKEFVPRLMLPLSLTADHRVIDGALATRFCLFIAQLLADMRRVLI